MLQEKLQSWLVSRIGIVDWAWGGVGTGGLVDGWELHFPSVGCGREERERFLGIRLHFRLQHDYKFSCFSGTTLVFII